MKKAYDRIESEYVIVTLEKLGFILDGFSGLKHVLRQPFFSCAC